MSIISEVLWQECSLLMKVCRKMNMTKSVLRRNCSWKKCWKEHVSLENLHQGEKRRFRATLQDFLGLLWPTLEAFSFLKLFLKAKSASLWRSSWGSLKTAASMVWDGHLYMPWKEGLLFKNRDWWHTWVPRMSVCHNTRAMHGLGYKI